MVPLNLTYVHCLQHSFFEHENNTRIIKYNYSVIEHLYYYAVKGDKILYTSQLAVGSLRIRQKIMIRPICSY